METETKNDTKVSKSNTITIKKDDLWKYSTFLLLAIVLVGGFMAFTGDKGTPTGAVVGANPSNPGQIPTPSVPAKVNVELTADDHFKFGDANSKVVIVEYSDFECPFCGRFFTGAYSQIKSKYENNKDVAFVYRNFPLNSIHPQAQKAAESAECAAEQGKFWDMHDKLFESGVAGGVSIFKSYAKQIGLNTGDFDSCLDSGKHASDVKEDLTSGQSSGVRGTPAFLINGQLVSGAQPFQVFEQVIDAELAA